MVLAFLDHLQRRRFAAHGYTIVKEICKPRCSIQLNFIHSVSDRKTSTKRGFSEMFADRASWTLLLRRLACRDVNDFRCLRCTAANLPYTRNKYLRYLASPRSLSPAFSSRCNRVRVDPHDVTIPIRLLRCKECTISVASLLPPLPPPINRWRQRREEKTRVRNISTHACQKIDSSVNSSARNGEGRGANRTANRIRRTRSFALCRDTGINSDLASALSPPSRLLEGETRI